MHTLHPHALTEYEVSNLTVAELGTHNDYKQTLHLHGLSSYEILDDQVFQISYHIAQWESARPNLDLPKIEARSKVSA